MEAVIIVLGVIGLISAVPITAIMTAHQRKMAEIRAQSHSVNAEALHRVMQEVAELRQLVHQQAILLDDVSALNKRLLERNPSDDSVRQRLNG